MVKFAKKNLRLSGKLRTVGKNAAAILIFAGALFTTVGMHNRQPVENQPLSFSGRKHLSLVIAVHANCPSSRATVAEAVRINYRVPGEVKVTALVFGADEKLDISQMPTLAGLAKVKSRILSDTNGDLARSLGLTNSAQALLFSPNGNLLYNGSITASPDRLGNPGEETVVEIIHGSSASSAAVAPHGCSLENSFCVHEHGLKTASAL